MIEANETHEVVDWRDEIVARGASPVADNGLLRTAGMLLAAFCLFNIALVQSGVAARGVLADINWFFESIRNFAVEPLSMASGLGVAPMVLATIADALLAAVVVFAISLRTKAEAEYDGELGDADPIFGFMFILFLIAGALQAIGVDWISPTDLRAMGIYWPMVVTVFLALVVLAYAFTPRAPATTAIAFLSNTVFSALVAITLLILNAAL